MFIQKISADAMITSGNSEELKTLVTQRREEILHSHAVYAALFNASGPLRDVDAGFVDL